MITKSKNGKIIREIKLPIGEALEFSSGLSFYFAPLKQFKNMNAPDLIEIKRDLEAQEILKEAEELSKKQHSEGWTREDFKKDFLKTRAGIIEYITKKQNGAKKRK